LDKNTVKRNYEFWVSLLQICPECKTIDNRLP